MKKRLSRYNPTSENILQNEKNRKNIGNELNDINGITVCGTILKGVGGIYSVYSDGITYSCQARGLFRHEKIKPLPGDSVNILARKDGVIKNEDDGGDGIIKEILPRKNSLIRPPLANIDNLFVIIASAYPDPSTVIADKLITIAEFNGIEPIIIISKSDLAPDSAAHTSDIYRKCGFNVFVTSSEKKEGIGGLRNFIIEKCGNSVNTFAGVSGAGKSTLMNTLFPSLSLETGELSQKIGRGKNTTRTSELFTMRELFGNLNVSEEDKLMHGFLADTPGFSMIDFTRFDFYGKDDLPYTFREFRPFLTKCRYTKCTHTKEDGCAILQAVKNGIIPEERHKSYLEIYNDIKDKHSWD